MMRSSIATRTLRRSLTLRVVAAMAIVSAVAAEPAQAGKRPAPIQRPAPAQRPTAARQAAQQMHNEGFRQTMNRADYQKAEPKVAAPAYARAAGRPAETPSQVEGQSGSPVAGAQKLVVPNRPGQTQQHLSGWMDAHRNLPLAEQQRSLENEPGFRTLPSQEQQRLHNRLSQLNAMPLRQQQQNLQRSEAMERLAPAQRQQVRGAMAQLGSLPEDRRHVVGRAFYQLRDMPPAQRQSYMNSPQFHEQFNEQERGAIGSLLNVAPIYSPLQPQPAAPR